MDREITVDDVLGEVPKEMMECLNSYAPRETQENILQSIKLKSSYNKCFKLASTVQIEKDGKIEILNRDAESSLIIKKDDASNICVYFLRIDGMHTELEIARIASIFFFSMLAIQKLNMFPIGLFIAGENFQFIGDNKNLAVIHEFLILLFETPYEQFGSKFGGILYALQLNYNKDVEGLRKYLLRNIKRVYQCTDLDSALILLASGYLYSLESNALGLSNMEKTEKGYQLLNILQVKNALSPILAQLYPRGFSFSSWAEKYVETSKRH